MESPMLDVGKALAMVLERVRPLAAIDRPLELAQDQVAAADVPSPEDVPPWDFSAMDGFAVRAGDLADASASTPVTLRVTGSVTAGHVAARPLGAGEAIRIMTGAPIPAGSDAVVKVEDTDTDAAAPNGVRIATAVHVRENVSPRAHDIQKGDVLVRAGVVLRPQELGVLASVGVAKVKVHRRPRLAVLATGDELVPASSALGPGQIRSSNSVTLVGQGREAGAEVTDLGIARDDLETIVGAMRRVPDADVIITSGGSARGDKDFAEESFRQMGVDILFHRVAIKPGKPVLFGATSGTLFFGLPGNPVASMLTFELFVRPALRKMQGLKRLERPRLAAKLGHAVDKEKGKVFYLRGVLSRDPEGIVVRGTGHQGSSVLSSMTKANAIAIIPSDVTHVEAGAAVDVMAIGEWE